MKTSSRERAMSSSKEKKQNKSEFLSTRRNFIGHAYIEDSTIVFVYVLFKFNVRNFYLAFTRKINNHL